MNHNPYRAPASPVPDLPTRAGYGSLIVAITPPALVSVGALRAVPQFATLFDELGAALPLGTSVLLATYHWWGLLVPVVTGLWWYRQRQARSQAVTVVFGAASALLLFGFGSWACYAPIFDLAKS